MNDRGRDRLRGGHLKSADKIREIKRRVPADFRHEQGFVSVGEQLIRGRGQHRAGGVQERHLQRTLVLAQGILVSAQSGYCDPGVDLTCLVSLHGGRKTKGKGGTASHAGQAVIPAEEHDALQVAVRSDASRACEQVSLPVGAQGEQPGGGDAEVLRALDDLSIEINRQTLSHRSQDVDLTGGFGDLVEAEKNNQTEESQAVAKLGKVEVKGLKYRRHGAGSDHEYVIVTAHHDAYFYGANDNASGVATLLVLARHIASRKRPPRHNYIFVATGSHHNGLAGATHFIENNKEILNRCVIVLNAEHTASLLEIEYPRLISSVPFDVL